MQNDFALKPQIDIESERESTIEVLKKKNTIIVKDENLLDPKTLEDPNHKIDSELVSECASDGSEVFYREYDIEEVEKSIAILYQRAQGSGLIS